jgi:hypothetical protein
MRSMGYKPESDKFKSVIYDGNSNLDIVDNIVRNLDEVYNQKNLLSDNIDVTLKNKKHY